MPDSNLKKLSTTWYIAMLHFQTGNYHESLKVSEPILTLNCNTEVERTIKSRIYNTSGASHLMLGNYKQALKEFRNSIRLSVDGPLLGMTYINLGTLFRRLGRFNQAKTSYLKALESSVSFIKLAAYTCLAQVALDQKQLDAARKYLFTGYCYAKKHKNLTGRGEVLVNLGVFYKEKNKYKRAEIVLSKAIKYGLKNKHKRTLDFAYLEMIDLSLRIGDITKAQYFLDMLPKQPNQLGELLLLGSWLNFKAQLYIEKRETVNARIILNKAYSVLSSVNTSSWELEKCLRLLEKTYLALHQPYVAELYKHQRLKIRRKLRAEK